MANGNRRPLAPVRKVIAAVLGTVAAFVILFGLGMASLAIVALGVALLVLAIGLVAVNAVRGGARAWAPGTAHVQSVSEPPPSSVYGRCELQIIIDAPGLPARMVKVRDPRVPVAKWPDVGATLPIMVAVDDPRHVRILWDDVMTHAEAAGSVDDLPGGDDPFRGDDDRGWRRPNGYETADLTDDLRGIRREEPVVVRQAGGHVVVEGTVVDPQVAPLPRRAPGPAKEAPSPSPSRKPSPRRPRSSAATEDTRTRPGEESGAAAGGFAGAADAEATAGAEPTPDDLAEPDGVETDPTDEAPDRATDADAGVVTAERSADEAGPATADAGEDGEAAARESGGATADPSADEARATTSDDDRAAAARLSGAATADRGTDSVDVSDQTATADSERDGESTTARTTGPAADHDPRDADDSSEAAGAPEPADTERETDGAGARAAGAATAGAAAGVAAASGAAAAAAAARRSTDRDPELDLDLEEPPRLVRPEARPDPGDEPADELPPAVPTVTRADVVPPTGRPESRPEPVETAWPGTRPATPADDDPTGSADRSAAPAGSAADWPGDQAEPATGTAAAWADDRTEPTAAGPDDQREPADHTAGAAPWADDRAEPTGADQPGDQPASAAAAAWADDRAEPSADRAVPAERANGSDTGWFDNRPVRDSDVDDPGVATEQPRATARFVPPAARRPSDDIAAMTPNLPFTPAAEQQPEPEADEPEADETDPEAEHADHDPPAPGSRSVYFLVTEGPSSHEPATAEVDASDEELDELITAYPSARPGDTGVIHGIGLTMLVTDLARSVEFYRDTLGFQEIDSGDRNAIVASGDTRIVLREIPEASPITRRLVHLNLEVGDVIAVYENLRAKGVKFTYAPRAVNRGAKLELWAAAFRDPDGHGIALTQWRSRVSN